MLVVTMVTQAVHKMQELDLKSNFWRTLASWIVTREAVLHWISPDEGVEQVGKLGDEQQVSQQLVDVPYRNDGGGGFVDTEMTCSQRCPSQRR